MITNVLLISRNVLPYFLVFTNQDKGNKSSCLSALVSLRRDIRSKVYESFSKAMLYKVSNKLKN